ncbi:hypothetical protein G7Y89_g15838 [Cudoniella acicularis]|uniref:Uncharacterized protein n=1 Tax=Cudoniella acicularis TaxID=354080 RepID=A0A8H4QEQ2_9HELO|nr:hypothetical protein G7Y89_g15838 [Cudoniella acicularis]
MYNKVFSEAMKKAERIQQRSTQSLASEIHDFLNRQRDVERQEIRQVVVDILHSRTRDSISNESLSTAKRMELESDSLPSPASNSSLFAGMPTPHLQKPNSESTSSSTPVDDSLSASSENGPGHTSSSSEPPLDGHFSSLPSQTIPPSWQFTHDNLGISTLPAYTSPTPQASDMLGINYCASTALTTTSSSENMSGTLSVANEFGIEQPFGKHYKSLSLLTPEASSRRSIMYARRSTVSRVAKSAVKHSLLINYRRENKDENMRLKMLEAAVEELIHVQGYSSGYSTITIENRIH